MPESLKFEIKPIGVIHSPLKEIADKVPIQGRLKNQVEGSLEIFPAYTKGLKDLAEFSHIYILYYFNRSKIIKLEAAPYLDNQPRGIFSIRSPHRPNHLGLTVIDLITIENNILKVKGLDVLDQTPLIDIKPYNHHFDFPGQGQIGWMTKYFQDDSLERCETIDTKEKWLHN